MKLKNHLLVVTELDRSLAFYREVLGLRKRMDFGVHVTLTGGLCLQTRESWAKMIEVFPNELDWCGKVSELYFETEDFDGFMEKLNHLEVHEVHEEREQRWGQRVVRFYDPDCHIIEVGETMKTVCRRFLNSGLTPEQVAARMEVPMKFVKSCIR